MKKRDIVIHAISWNSIILFGILLMNFVYAQNGEIPKYSGLENSKNADFGNQANIPKNFIQMPPSIIKENHISEGEEKVIDGNVAVKKARLTNKVVASGNSPVSAEFSIKESSEKPPSQASKKRGGREPNFERFYQNFDQAALEKNNEAMQHALSQFGEDDVRLHIGVMRRKGWYLFSEQKYQAALDIYLQILQRLPNDRNTIINVALLEMRLGEEQLGLSRLKRFQMINSNDSDVNRLINRFDSQYD